MTDAKVAAVARVGVRRDTGRLSLWLVPALALGITVAVFVYIGHADLDDIEARALRTSAVIAALRQHIALVAVSTVAVIAIGVPLGVILSRSWAAPIRPVVLFLANGGQAVPSIGVLVLLALLFGIGFSMAIVALVLYALLPVLRNTLVGIQQVPPEVTDAARGMGMSARQRLWRIELPLSMPVMLAGIRLAVILNVGVATLATFTNAGGLGDLIELGIVFNRLSILVSGSLLTVALALLVDWLTGVIGTALQPKGI